MNKVVRILLALAVLVPGWFLGITVGVLLSMGIGWLLERIFGRSDSLIIFVMGAAYLGSCILGGTVALAAAGYVYQITGPKPATLDGKKARGFDVLQKK